jgi:hypothetical protein
MQQPTVYDHRNVYDDGAGGGGSSSSGIIFWTRFSNFDTNTLIDTPIIGERYKLLDTAYGLYSIITTTTRYTVGNINLLKIANANQDNTVLMGYVPLPTPEDGNFSVRFICTVVDVSDSQYLCRLRFYDINDVFQFESEVNWHNDGSDHWELWATDSFTYNTYNYAYFDENAWGYNQFGFDPSKVAQNIPHVIRVDYVNGDITIYIDSIVALVVHNVPRPYSMRLRPDTRVHVTVGVTEVSVMRLP